MAKSQKVANVAVVETVEITPEVVTENNSAQIVEFVLTQLPSVGDAKAKLDEALESEADYKLAKSILNNFNELKMDAVETLTMQVATYKDTDKDRAALASQKLEMINRYSEWKSGIDKLREEVNSSYAVLDEVIAKLREVRGHKPSAKGGNGSGGTGKYPCTVTKTSDSTVLNFRSLNSAVDELIPKENRSPVLDANKVHELDSKGEPKYYSMSGKSAKAALTRAGYEVQLG